MLPTWVGLFEWLCYLFRLVEEMLLLIVLVGLLVLLSLLVCFDCFVGISWFTTSVGW